MHHHHAPANEDLHGTAYHRGDGIPHIIPNGHLPPLHGRGRKALKWTVLAASVVAVVSLQNMFWFSLRVIPDNNNNAAYYGGGDHMEGSSTTLLLSSDGIGESGMDGVDKMKNESFISTKRTRLPPYTDLDITTQTGRRVVVLSDRPFHTSINSGRSPHRPLGSFVNSTLPTLVADSDGNETETTDGDPDPNNNFLLSARGTLAVDKSDDNWLYRDFEREWFQDCKPVTDPDEEDDTVNPMKGIRPTCNAFHELDFMADDDGLTTDANFQRPILFPTESIELLSMQGSWRSVWKVTATANYSTSDSDAPRSAALKLLQLDRDFNEESYSMHQMDAMVMESLTASPHIIDSYGFCGQSVLTAFAESSGRARIKDQALRWVDRLRLGRDLAQGLADLHALQPTGGSSSRSATDKQPPPPHLFAHHDINMANLIALKDGRVQWNDFNLGIVTRQRRNADTGDNQECLVPIRYGGPLWRSPEEIQNQTGYLTNMQAADVYSLGNVLFQVLTKHQPWSHLENVDDNENNNNTATSTNKNSTEKTPPGNNTNQTVVVGAKVTSTTDVESKEQALRMIAQSKIDGRLPNIPDRYVTRKEAQILWNATKACYRANPTDRPTALQVAELLGKAYDKYNKQVDSATVKRKYIR